MFVTVRCKPESVTPANDPASDMRRSGVFLQRLLAGTANGTPASGRRITAWAISRIIISDHALRTRLRIRSSQFQTNSNTSYLNTAERLKSPAFSRQAIQTDKKAPRVRRPGTSSKHRARAPSRPSLIAFSSWNYTGKLPPKAALDSFVVLLAIWWTTSPRASATSSCIANSAPPLPGEATHPLAAQPTRDPQPRVMGSSMVCRSWTGPLLRLPLTTGYHAPDPPNLLPVEDVA